MEIKVIERKIKLRVFFLIEFNLIYCISFNYIGRFVKSLKKDFVEFLLNKSLRECESNSFVLLKVIFLRIKNLLLINRNSVYYLN